MFIAHLSLLFAGGLCNGTIDAGDQATQSQREVKNDKEHRRLFPARVNVL
jgi:hypothetical protein